MSGHLQDAILARLASGPAPVAELALLLERGPRLVRQALWSLRDRGHVERVPSVHPALWRSTHREVPLDADVLTALRILRVATLDQLAARSGWSRPSVERAVKRLERRGRVWLVTPSVQGGRRGRWPARWARTDAVGGPEFSSSRPTVVAATASDAQGRGSCREREAATSRPDEPLRESR